MLKSAVNQEIKTLYIEAQDSDVKEILDKNGSITFIHTPEKLKIKVNFFLLKICTYEKTPLFSSDEENDFFRENVEDFAALCNAIKNDESNQWPLQLLGVVSLADQLGLKVVGTDNFDDSKAYKFIEQARENKTVCQKLIQETTCDSKFCKKNHQNYFKG